MGPAPGESGKWPGVLGLPPFVPCMRMQLLDLPRGVLTLGDPLLLLLLWMQQTSTGTMRTKSSSKLASAAAAGQTRQYTGT
jgi:hypothetical protein